MHAAHGWSGAGSRAADSPGAGALRHCLLACGTLVVGLFAVGLLAAGLPATASAQIIDTLSGFDRDEPGWSGRVGLLFSLSGGNTDLLSLGASGRLQWQDARERVRVLGAATREEADGETQADSWRVHVRHNHHLGGPWYTLAFVQSQQNVFQRLKRRRLFGAGGRVDLVSNDDGVLECGGAYMFELERIAGAADSDADHRASLFVHANLQLGPSAKLGAVIFFQPLLADVTDHRTTATVILSATVVGGLELVVSGGYQRDSEPPSGVEKEDYELQTGLTWGF